MNKISEEKVKSTQIIPLTSDQRQWLDICTEKGVIYAHTRPIASILLTTDQREWVDLRAGMAGMVESSAIVELIQDQINLGVYLAKINLTESELIRSLIQTEVDIAKEQGII